MVVVVSSDALESPSMVTSICSVGCVGSAAVAGGTVQDASIMLASPRASELVGGLFICRWADAKASN